ncbi:hypothetical protein ACU4GD_35525 [Cupriavidus basilensis]
MSAPKLSRFSRAAEAGIQRRPWFLAGNHPAFLLASGVGIWVLPRRWCGSQVGKNDLLTCALHRPGARPAPWSGWRKSFHRLHSERCAAP